MNAFERLGIDGRPVSGHAFLVQRARGPQWYVKFRLPDGRQVQRRLGPAWTGRGRPAVGYLTRRSAQAVLDELLAQSRAGTLPGMVRTGATFAQASGEWLRWQELDRQRKRSTLDDYSSVVRAHLNPAFGPLALEEVTARRIEDWRRSLVEQRRLSNRSINKLLILLHGIFERARRVWGLGENPVRAVDRQPVVRRSHIDVYALEEVLALVRAAESDQDGALFLTAALTGLRMGELLALRWRDVDFAMPGIRVRASYSHRELTTPKSGKGRAVPMVDAVAQALARLGQRDRFTGPDDLVFPGLSAATSTTPPYAAGSRPPVLRRACEHCAFTICATPSAPMPSAPLIPANSRNGWATPTSRPPRFTSRTNLAPMLRCDSLRRSGPQRMTASPSASLRRGRASSQVPRAPQRCCARA